MKRFATIFCLASALVGRSYSFSYAEPESANRVPPQERAEQIKAAIFKPNAHIFVGAKALARFPKEEALSVLLQEQGEARGDHAMEVAFLLALLQHEYDRNRQYILQAHDLSESGELVRIECLGYLCVLGDDSLVELLVQQGATCDAGICTSLSIIYAKLALTNVRLFLDKLSELSEMAQEGVIKLATEGLQAHSQDMRGRLSRSLDVLRSNSTDSRAPLADKLFRALNTFNWELRDNE